MGRALFSLAYYAAPEPAVRREPEPQVDTCAKWSVWNRFDPDSDDFFQDAEYEAFIDHIPERQPVQMAAGLASSDSMDLENTSDASRVSPMAAGLDGPLVFIQRRPGYNGWNAGGPMFHIEGSALTDRSSSPDSDFSSSAPLSPIHNPVLPPDADQLDNPPFIPPLSFRGPSPAIEEPASPVYSAHSPTLGRTAETAPITVSLIEIQPATRSPSPDMSSTPSTPARQIGQTMLTPSPPPSVTPRFYSWQHHPIPALPVSPTIRGNARMPFPRQGNTPTRIRISNSVM